MSYSPPTNTACFTLDEVVAATGGEVLRAGQRRARGVTTDSRRRVAGSVFVALEGARFDGHAFLSHAARAGAAMVLLRDAEAAPDDATTVVRVPDTLVALGALAQAHRRRWAGRLVAVAGSAGKTTTRRAVAALLHDLAPGEVHATAGNFNNRVGVPLVLLGLRDDHRIGVVELGTSLPGEVEMLRRMAEPDLAILTLVALEHAAQLVDLDGVEHEEGALLRGLHPEAIAVANADSPGALRQLDRSPARRRIRYGEGAGSDYRLAARAVSLDASGFPDGTRLTIERGDRRETVHTSLLGAAGGLAATAAFATAEALLGAVEPAQVTAALTGPGVAEPGRLTPLVIDHGALVIDDSYNACPASVRSSAATAHEIATARGGRLHLVLGEMGELGPGAAGEHERLGAELATFAPESLIATVGHARALARGARETGLSADYLDDTDAIAPRLSARLRPEDVVLVKGSRHVGGERVVAALRARTRR